MSLNKPQLENDLRALFDATLDSDTSEQQAKDAFIQGLANIIDGYIKTAKIKYTGGLVAPNGSVTGTINHTIE